MSDAVRSVVDSLDVKVKVSVAELLNPPSDTDAVIDEVGEVVSDGADGDEEEKALMGLGVELMIVT